MMQFVVNVYGFFRNEIAFDYGHLLTANIIHFLSSQPRT